MCVVVAQEPGVVLSRPRRISLAPGWKRSPAPQDPGGPSPHAAKGIQAPSASPDPQRRSVKTRDLSGHGRDHLPAAEDLGFASLRSPFRPSAESDYVSFPPSSQPNEASRSFLDESDAGFWVLTCARMIRERRPELLQWQPAASVLEVSAEAPGRRGGWGGAGQRGRDRPLGSGLSTSSPSVP